jgi:rSAM/selenodomain-associated transferase 2
MNGPLVSVVVPVLDEAGELPRALDRLAALAGAWEVLVVDGESRDRTVQLARTHPLGPRVLTAGRGRASAMNAGAAVASGDVLLFLHADTALPHDAYRHLAAALADPAVAGGSFRVRFGGGDRFAELLGAIAAVQQRLGVVYGDSAIFARASVFRSLDGYRDLPIMEDYDFARRLRRAGRTVRLGAEVVTSDRRWRERGRLRTVSTWAAIQALYSAGLEPTRLARLYRAVR